MPKLILLLLSFALLAGCAGQSRYSQTGDHTYELIMEDNGFMNKANSSRLDKEWEAKAQEICPRGFTVQSQTYTQEKAFEAATLTGTIVCR